VFVNVRFFCGFHVGELKGILAPLTGLHPREQRLLFRGKEKDDLELLHMAGVDDKSKITLVEDPAGKDRKGEEMYGNAGVSRACQAVAGIREVVDKLASQVNQGKLGYVNSLT
jgi:hypothetical protein